MDYLKHNQIAWDKQVKKNNKWTVRVTGEEIKNAKEGQWQVLLTTWKKVPQEWFPQMEGLKILCLAGGGGQQAPIFSAAGADVTVLDISPAQLQQDKTTAELYNLNLKTVIGDMTDLSIFEDATFDIVFHPVANCFVPNILPVWDECHRVLKVGGILMSGFANPVLYLFDESDPEKEIAPTIKNKIPYSDLDILNKKQKDSYIQNGYPFEFGHTLEDQIGGQIRAGFIIDGFYEDKIHHPEHPLYNHISTFIATRAMKI